MNNLSQRKQAVIKDLEYDFPQSVDSRIQLKAYDKVLQLACKKNQKI